MKRSYEKPMIYVERFTLAQSIARGCTFLDTFGGTSATLNSKETCGVILGGSTYFADNLQNVCPAGEWDEFCYNAPSEGTVLFAS